MTAEEIAKGFIGLLEKYGAEKQIKKLCAEMSGYELAKKLSDLLDEEIKKEDMKTDILKNDCIYYRSPNEICSYEKKCKCENYKSLYSEHDWN